MRATPRAAGRRLPPRRGRRRSPGLRRTAAAAALGLIAWGPVRGQDPVQWWNAFTSGSKAPGGAVEAKAEWRVFEGGDVSLWGAEASWLLRAERRVAWGPGYKYQEVRQPGGSFLGERRYLLNGRVRLGGAAGRKAGLRALYEYRDREGAPRSWRGRLRGEARRPLGGSGWDVGVSNEVFFDSAADRYAQNRLQIILFRRLGATAGFSVYYLLRSDRLGRHWEETQVLGTVWSFP
jgi:hypothetical protein